MLSVDSRLRSRVAPGAADGESPGSAVPRMARGSGRIVCASSGQLPSNDDRCGEEVARNHPGAGAGRTTEETSSEEEGTGNHGEEQRTEETGRWEAHAAET